MRYGFRNICAIRKCTRNATNCGFIACPLHCSIVTPSALWLFDVFKLVEIEVKGKPRPIQLRLTRNNLLSMRLNHYLKMDLKLQ